MIAIFTTTHLKKITMIQLFLINYFQLQFCITFLHSAQLLFYDCGYPRWSVVFTIPNSIFFYYLFYDFYYKAYGKPGDKKPSPTEKLAKSDANGNIKANGVSNGHANSKKDE